MSLRWKVALAMAAIVALATVALGAASYRSTSDRLLDEVDRSLRSFDGLVADRRLNPEQLPERNPLTGFEVQVLDPRGVVVRTTFGGQIPVNDSALEVVGSPLRNSFSTVETSEGSYRVRTVGIERGAIQIGRSLDETDRVLESLRRRILLLTALVVGAATAAGWWIAGRVTASLRRLTSTAEQVERTGRLDVAVGERGSDEVGRLGVAFDRMLAALARSKEEQQRLVQDAGHELRTPLTSMRTNVDILRRFPGLDISDRDAVIDDLHAETEELTELVDEIIVVASGGASNEPPGAFDLADLAREVAARYGRRTDREIEVFASPSPVVAQRSGVQRAISCLLDNARKFDGSGGPIEITVADGTVTVADRGAGIPDAELPLVFERFHRAEDARALPGAGLGLSIVREVARRHGGDAFARNRVDGGAEVGFSLVRPSSHPPA